MSFITNMNHQLECIVSNFLKHHLDPNRPLLLALSGGPDSLCLLHLLLQYKKQFSLNLGIAHIDHGWRTESSEEAKQLCEMAEQLGVTFHLKVIYPTELSGNLEEASRKERLRFFSLLCRQHHYQAVMLAHHADDQAETVLKRIFEGADIPHLSALQEVNTVDGVILWRPLLKVSKTMISQWVDLQGLVPFNDRTNLDPAFLRGRFRTQIIPELSKMFGKEVSGNLCRFADETKELTDYVSNSLEPYLARIEKGRFGTLLDLSKDCPPFAFAVKFLVRELCRRAGFTLSRPLVETAYDLIISGKGNRQLAIGQYQLYIDRKRIFVVNRKLDNLPPLQPITIGASSYGDWKVTASHETANTASQGSNWRHVWNGKVIVALPEGDYYLGPALMNAPYPGQTAISRWWTNEKVPAFLRHVVPVIWREGIISHEFLTHRPDAKKSAGRWITITLELKG